MTSRASNAPASRIATLLLAALLAATIVACEKEEPVLPDPIRPVKMYTVPGPGAGATREYPGRIKAGQYSEMGFEVPGKVERFVYTEGSNVKMGAVLAELDPRDYQARYDSAIAKEAHAKSERDRFKAMYDKDVKPYSEYESKLRMWEVRKAETREAKKALDDTVLRAPFEGVMARKLVEEFESVLAKQPVLVLQNDTMLEIKVSVPERDLARGPAERASDDELTAILKPRVVVSSLPGREFPAALKELASVADPTTRTFEATFRFTRPDDANILGGMTAKVIIDVPATRVTKGVIVPVDAVIAGGEGADDMGVVWVIDPETMVASRREVKLGGLSADGIQLDGGLEPGEVIAVSGVHHLRDGMTVRRLER